jgi:hypothetical protein
MGSEYWKGLITLIANYKGKLQHLGMVIDVMPAENELLLNELNKKQGIQKKKI